jgi:hypothetical protein
VRLLVLKEINAETAVCRVVWQMVTNVGETYCLDLQVITQQIPPKVIAIYGAKSHKTVVLSFYQPTKSIFL